jgi:hypothetical protein
VYILIDDNVSFFQKTRKQESNHNVNEDDTAEKREDRYLLRARANKERERKRVSGCEIECLIRIASRVLFGFIYSLSDDDMWKKQWTSRFNDLCRCHF